MVVRAERINGLSRAETKNILKIPAKSSKKYFYLPQNPDKSREKRLTGGEKWSVAFDHGLNLWYAARLIFRTERLVLPSSSSIKSRLENCDRYRRSFNFVQSSLL